MDRPPSPYFVYSDEWIQAPTPDFGRILAETRKFGLLLVLANQDLSQIKTVFGGGFKESLLTLCQMQFCFGGINDTDAARLSREWGVESQTVRELAERQCLVKLPRQRATVINVPDVKDPYLREETIEEFERCIAQQTGAVLIEEVDKLLATSQDKQAPAKKLTDEDFLL